MAMIEPVRNLTDTVQPDRDRSTLTLTGVDADREIQRRFAYALRAAMAEKGWSSPELARQIGRDPSTVSRWVNGDSVPSLLVLKALADALEVRPDFLFDPPEVPAYPIAEYLVRRAADAGVEEGARRAARPVEEP
jgi:transcriptional regulator with XRE-family HTH domain